MWADQCQRSRPFACGRHAETRVVRVVSLMPALAVCCPRQLLKPPTQCSTADNAAESAQKEERSLRARFPPATRPLPPIRRVLEIEAVRVIPFGQSSRLTVSLSSRSVYTAPEFREIAPIQQRHGLWAFQGAGRIADEYSSGLSWSASRTRKADASDRSERAKCLQRL